MNKREVIKRVLDGHGPPPMPSSKPLNFDISRSPYQAMIGTGGVGSGTFFALQGNHTLGREESRAGTYLDRQDYCKLHIISHYVKVLLGPCFAVFPASKVGADNTGRRLLAEMELAGLDLRHMEIDETRPTLFSFCYTYPDGSGGNLTTLDAATAAVDPDFVDKLRSEFDQWAGRAVALAVPEVPLAARQRLLELGTAGRCLRVASLTSDEARSGQSPTLLQNVDLLALNLDEAAALAGMARPDQSPTDILRNVMACLQSIRPAIQLSVTAGKLGSWCCDGRAIAHTPVFPVEVVSTAGAGDAHLAGVIAGLVAGLSLPQAHQLGALTAACAITSPHTIHPGLDAAVLGEVAARHASRLALPVQQLLHEA